MRAWLQRYQLGWSDEPERAPRLRIVRLCASSHLALRQVELRGPRVATTEPIDLLRGVHNPPFTCSLHTPIQPSLRATGHRFTVQAGQTCLAAWLSECFRNRGATCYQSYLRSQRRAHSFGSSPKCRTSMPSLKRRRRACLRKRLGRLTRRCLRAGRTGQPVTTAAVAARRAAPSTMEMQKTTLMTTRSGPWDCN